MTDEELRELRAAIEAERRRSAHQVEALTRTFDGVVAAAELVSTDDEHDPEGSTIAYERAQVSALLRQARIDLVALDAALGRLEAGDELVCAVCAGPIAVERLLAIPATRRCIGCARA